MTKINTCIIGVGDVGSALVQGVENYKKNPDNIIGLLPEITQYTIDDINFVLGIDVNSNKVEKDLSEAIFGEPALVNKLRTLVFDLQVIRKFHLAEYDIKQYAKSIKEAVIKYNESALETIEIALKFMRNHAYEDILYYWNALDFLSQQELSSQSKIDRIISTLAPEPIEKS